MCRLMRAVLTPPCIKLSLEAEGEPLWLSCRNLYKVEKEKLHARKAGGSVPGGIGRTTSGTDAESSHSPGSLLPSPVKKPLRVEVRLVAVVTKGGL
jgi:hypothetical protein